MVPRGKAGASRWLGRKSIHEVRMLLKDMLLKDGLLKDGQS
jgi:hypothetical protein